MKLEELKGIISDITHDSDMNRNYLQARADKLIYLSKKHNLKLQVKERKRCADFPLDMSIPELKLYDVITVDELEYLKNTIQEEEE